VRVRVQIMQNLFGHTSHIVLTGLAEQSL